ncbi:1921_t:CDS:2, partial [Funneliformis geosporum]
MKLVIENSMLGKHLFNMQFEFWSRVHNTQIDNVTLQVLYKSRSLQPRSENFTDTFWQAFCDALKGANRDPNGQRQFLSIIATQFTYQELKSKLG